MVLPFIFTFCLFGEVAVGEDTGGVAEVEAIAFAMSAREIASPCAFPEKLPERMLSPAFKFYLSVKLKCDSLFE